MRQETSLDMGHQNRIVHVLTSFVLVLLSAGCLTRAQSSSRSVPEIVRNGTFLISAAIEVHFDTSPGVTRCTRLSPRGLQMREALGQAIDAVNLPGLGGVVLNSGCMETAASLIASTGYLNDLFSQLTGGRQDAGFVFVDAASSNASFAVAQLLALYGLNVVNIPALPAGRAISARAAGSEGLLTQTRPALSFDVKIMADILGELWIENVALIAIDTTEGKAIRAAFLTALEGLSRRRSVQVLSDPLSVTLPAVPSSEDISKGGLALASATPPGTAYILLCPEQVVRQMFAEARKRNASANGTLILALEKWSLKGLTDHDVSGIGNIISIRFAPPLSKPPQLEQYFRTVSQLWKFSPYLIQPYLPALEMANATCSAELSSMRQKPFDQEAYKVCQAWTLYQVVVHSDVVFFYDSILALGQILRSLSTTGNAIRFNITKGNPEAALSIIDQAIMRQLHTKTFQGYSRQPLDYRQTGFELLHGEYEIDFLAMEKSVLSRVGRWLKAYGAENASLNLEAPFSSAWRFTGESCRTTCQPGTFRNSKRSPYLGRRCWVCERCPIGISNDTNVELCRPCPPSYAPRVNRDSCYLPELEYLRWSDPAAIVELVFAVIGFVLVCVCLEVFRRHINTPIVRAASRELSITLLLDMALLFLAVPLQMAKPSTTICATRLVVNTLLISFYMATLLVISMRLWIVFRKPEATYLSKRELNFLSNRSLLIYIFVLGICGGLLALVSVLLGQTEADIQQPKPTQRILQCKPSNVGFALPFAYSVILAIIAGLMAFLTRNLPLQYNETTFIIVTVSLSIFAWMVSGILGQQAVGDPGSEQLWSGSALLLTAYVALFGQFAPKVRIILFYPERNKRGLSGLSASKKVHSTHEAENESVVNSETFYRLKLDETAPAPVCPNDLCQCPWHNLSPAVPRYRSSPGSTREGSSSNLLNRTLVSNAIKASKLEHNDSCASATDNSGSTQSVRHSTAV